MDDGTLLATLREAHLLLALLATVVAAGAAPAALARSLLDLGRPGKPEDDTPASPPAPPVRAPSVFDLRFTSIDGDDLPLARFAGKAVLVVNTASSCGYTHQYAELQELWRAYRDRGLVVLGVPSNDFHQEGGTEAKIKRFSELNFGVDFPLTAKSRVRGPDAHPLFRFIAARLGARALPRWNFGKYLITPEGEVAAFWPSPVPPTSAEIVEAVERVLPLPPTDAAAMPRPASPAAVSLRRHLPPAA